jgi:arylsulfatase A-like enzyme
MVGKWHLGHAKKSQAPIGRGFDSFTGCFMWDIDSYTKQKYEVPWIDPLIDWVDEYSNGTFYHYAEPLHATEAITKDAMRVMDNHVRAHHHPLPSNRNKTSSPVGGNSSDPLFLYVAYTAAHSPLQPLHRHTIPCRHIPHIWRREYCGMMVGLDEGIKNITDHIKKTLGENTLIVVASDNGGSTWFGGMNVPLRGAKITPFEGGTRVPGFILDLTHNQRYLGGSIPGNKSNEVMNVSSNNEFYGLMHFSDWLPTLLSFAGVPATQFPKGLDGVDQTNALQSFRIDPVAANADPYRTRNEILYEMYFSEEFIFPEGLVALRIGDYKLVKGVVRDSDYYYESTNNFLNHSSSSWTSRSFESLIQIGELIWGNGPFDGIRVSQTHINMQNMGTKKQRIGEEDTNRLYNVRDDPTESTNLYYQPDMKAIIAQIEQKAEEYQQNRLPPQKAHYMFKLADWRAKTHVKGDCSMNPAIPEHQCRFTHPWIREVINLKRKFDKHKFSYLYLLILFLILL